MLIISSGIPNLELTLYVIHLRVLVYVCEVSCYQLINVRFLCKPYGNHKATTNTRNTKEKEKEI